MSSANDIVVATGATWGTPMVPGGAAGIRSLADVRDWLHGGRDDFGDDLVVLGHGKASLSIGELAVQRGHRVTVVGSKAYFAAELGLPGRYRLVAELEAAGARLITNATVDAVGDQHVDITHGGMTERLTADTVIGIAPTTQVTTLADELATSSVRVHTIGDCHRLGFIEGATTDALALARSIG